MQMSMNPTRFETPGMGRESKRAYNSLYGDDGINFVRVLRDPPMRLQCSHA